jgi:hypothetical protein
MAVTVKSTVLWDVEPYNLLVYTFWRKLLLPSSGWKNRDEKASERAMLIACSMIFRFFLGGGLSLRPVKWRQRVLSHRPRTCTEQNDATSQDVVYLCCIHLA